MIKQKDKANSTYPRQPHISNETGCYSFRAKAPLVKDANATCGSRMADLQKTLTQADAEKQLCFNEPISCIGCCVQDKTGEHLTKKEITQSFEERDPGIPEHFVKARESVDAVIEFVRSFRRVFFKRRTGGQPIGDFDKHVVIVLSGVSHTSPGAAAEMQKNKIWAGIGLSHDLASREWSRSTPEWFKEFNLSDVKYQEALTSYPGYAGWAQKAFTQKSCPKGDFPHAKLCRMYADHALVHFADNNVCTLLETGGTGAEHSRMEQEGRLAEAAKPGFFNYTQANSRMMMDFLNGNGDMKPCVFPGST